MKKLGICFMVFLLMIIGSCKIYATSEEGNNVSALQTTAIVIETGEIKELQTDYSTSKAQEIKVEILEGEYKTKEYTMEYTFSCDLGEQNEGYQLEVGDKVTVQMIVDENGNVMVNLVDIVRDTKLIGLGVAFIMISIFVMGKKSIKLVSNLLIIILSIYLILIKGIYSGQNAVFMTSLTVLVIALLNSAIMVGFNKKAFTIALATFCSVLISGIIAYLFSHWMKLSGLFEDTVALNMNMAVSKFSFRDLIFVGIVIATLGICMNNSVLLVSKLDELKNKTEDMSCKELFKTGMEVGRNFVNPMIHTVVLIYIGSMVTILFMFLACNVRITQMLNKETIAEDAIAAMANGIGILLNIPITASLYAFFHNRKTIYKTKSENKLEGNRSLKL